MAEITLRGNAIHTVGDLPAVGSPAPAFTLAGGNLADVTLGDFAGKALVINIFPSIDTGTCQASVRNFNEKAGSRDDVTVLNVSADLPFAQSRFCGAEGIENVKTGSTFRGNFGEQFGVTLAEGPMAGLMARAVVVVDANGNVVHSQLVPEIAQEPDYDAAIAALG